MLKFFFNGDDNVLCNIINFIPCVNFIANITASSNTSTSIYPYQGEYTMSEFGDVFQEVPGLPPHREVEFTNEVEKDMMHVVVLPTEWLQLN